MMDTQEQLTPTEQNAGSTERTTPSDIKTLASPVLVAAVFGIAGLNLHNPTLFNLVAHIGLITIVVWHVHKHHRASWQRASLLGGLAGAAVGFLVALYKLIAWFNLIYVFNLATQSIFAGVLDAIGAGFLFLILQSIHNTQTAKGGDEHD